MNSKEVKEWIDHRHQLLAEYNAREGTYAQVLDLLSKRLELYKSDAGISGLVKGRVKSFEGFYRKLLERSMQTPVSSPFDDITDLIGLRVVVPFLEDAQTIQTMVQKKFDVLEVENKSIGRSIQEFGYDSTHILIEVPGDIMEQIAMGDLLVCEIQIRTILQDAWAEVEHELVYKTEIDNDKIDIPIRRKLIALNATLSLADTIFQELRDYQKKKYHDINYRHQKLLDKVSTIPEKIGKFQEPYIPDFQEAKRAKLVEDPSDMNNLYIEAINAHLENKFDRALELYTQLILISPNHYIYNHRGLVYFAMSDYRKAVDDFTTAIEMEPKDTRVYTNRGLAYRMLGMLEKAVVEFDKSIELNPLWVDTFYGRALTYYDMGNIGAAIRDCDTAINIKPDFKQVVRFKQFLLKLM